MWQAQPLQRSIQKFQELHGSYPGKDAKQEQEPGTEMVNIN